MSQRLDGVTVQAGQLKHFGFNTTLYGYTCDWCKLPGTDNKPNTQTHPYCRAARKAAKDRGRKR